MLIKAWEIILQHFTLLLGIPSLLFGKNFLHNYPYFIRPVNESGQGADIMLTLLYLTLSKYPTADNNWDNLFPPLLDKIHIWIISK